MTIRLNKLIAWRGVAARRKADEMIAAGMVRVNGQVVREPGTMVDEESDHVLVRNKPLPPPQRAKWFMLHKPVGVISTVSDPEGRRTVRELLPTGSRVFPVGRLDADTSGLLLLTNDGPLAHRLMHPSYGVEKVYRVRLGETPRPDQMRRLAQGVRFDEGMVSAPAQVRPIDPGFDAIMLEIRIHEGRFRQVRRMCEAVGLPVLGLHRVAYGPLRLGPLPRGEYRELAHAEVTLLRTSTARPQSRPAGRNRLRGGRAADEAKRRAIYMHGVDMTSRPEEQAPSARTSAQPAERDRTERGPWPPPAASSRPPQRASRPAPRAVEHDDEDDDEEFEERWGPGMGGGQELFDEEWPARPSGSRGDSAFLEGGGQERPRSAPRARTSGPARESSRGAAPPRRKTPTTGPAGRRNEPASKERTSEAAPRGRRSEGRPSGRREDAAPRGRRTEAAPRGRRTEAAPRGRRTEAAPRGRRTEAAPRGRRTEAAPRGRRTEAAPRGRRTEATPKGRAASKGSARGFTQRTDRRGPATPQRGRNAKRKGTAGPSGTAVRKRGGGVISPRRRKG